MYYMSNDLSKDLNKTDKETNVTASLQNNLIWGITSTFAKKRKNPVVVCCLLWKQPQCARNASVVLKNIHETTSTVFLPFRNAKQKKKKKQCHNYFPSWILMCKFTLFDNVEHKSKPLEPEQISNELHTSILKLLHCSQFSINIHKNIHTETFLIKIVCFFSNKTCENVR